MNFFFLKNIKLGIFFFLFYFKYFGLLLYFRKYRKGMKNNGFLFKGRWVCRVLTSLGSYMELEGRVCVLFVFFVFVVVGS